MKKQLLAAVGGGLALADGGLARRYHRDRDAARARLAAVDRTVIETAFGAVEYVERGAGEPLLAIHGIFGGCDQGLVSVDGLFPGRRVIAPSRFGYLGSALPPGATPAVQAGAFAALLDALQITSTDVVAFSAGAASALQLALRHPGAGQPPGGDLRVLAGRPDGQGRAAGQPAAGALGVPDGGAADLRPARPGQGGRCPEGVPADRCGRSHRHRPDRHLLPGRAQGRRRSSTSLSPSPTSTTTTWTRSRSRS